MFPLWNWVCPLPRGRPSGSKPAAQRPFPSSCLLFWLNTAGSSTWAPCPWHGYPPLPQPCLSPSSALRVGYDPVADPKDWSQPGGENWLQSGGRNACILMVETEAGGQQRRKSSAERQCPAQPLPGQELRPDPRAWGGGSGQAGGRRAQGSGEQQTRTFGDGCRETSTALPRVTGAVPNSGCGTWSQASLS